MSIRDGDWTLLKWDAHTGASTWVTYDGHGNAVYRTDTPVTDVIEANKAARAETDARRFGEWSRIASVPMALAYQNGLIEAQAQGDDAFIKRFLNDSDNRAWRTHEGTV